MDCLVIIDVQKGFLNNNTKDIPKKIMELVNKKKFDNIVATKFQNINGGPFVNLMKWNKMLDNKSQELDENIKKTVDKVFVKNVYSCFTTDFLSFIEKKKIDKLYFVGIDTEGCVLKSAIDCFERNIKLEVLINYCASTSGILFHNAGITVMEKTLGIHLLNKII